MASVNITVSVPKETHELASAIVSIVESARQALADGFQPGMDIPVILMGSMTALTAGVQGMDQIPAEAKADLGGFMTAWGLAGAKIAGMFVKTSTSPVMPDAI